MSEVISETDFSFNLYDKEKKDGSYLIEEMLNTFNQCLKETSVVNYGDSFSIDETLSYCSCRTKFIQKITRKPAEKGILSYCLCKPNAPYVFHIMFYRGKSIKGANNVGSKIFTKILEDNYEIFSNCTHVKLFMDSFFSNVQLGLLLDWAGISFISTLSSNRKYIPEVVKSFKGMDNGDVRCFKVCGSELKFIQVKDKLHDTTLFTNESNINKVVKVYRRNNYPNSQFYEKEITFAQYEYRHGMCGVDIFDRGCSVVNVRRRTTRWTVAYFEILVNATLVNVFTIMNSCYRQKVASEKQVEIQNLPQTIHLNRRVTLYKLGRHLCEKLQEKNLEKRKYVFHRISFEAQLEIIKRSIKNTKRRNCCVHSLVYKGRRDSSKYCPHCNRPCCPMHFAANGICYLCNRFNVEQIKTLDEIIKKYGGK